MVWDCPQCCEKVEGNLAVCWACGTDRDGTLDPEFQTADDYEPPVHEDNIQFSVPRFSLGGLISTVTVLCLYLGVLGGALTELSHDIPTILTLVLLFGAGSYISLFFMTWLLTRRGSKSKANLRDDGQLREP